MTEAVLFNYRVAYASSSALNQRNVWANAYYYGRISNTDRTDPHKLTYINQINHFLTHDKPLKGGELGMDCISIDTTAS